MGDQDAKFSISRQYLSTPDQEQFGQSKPILRKKPNLNPLKLMIIASKRQECRIYRKEFQCLKEVLGGGLHPGALGADSETLG